MRPSRRRLSTSAVTRLAATLSLAATGLVAAHADVSAPGAAAVATPPALAPAHCGPGSLPEKTQGRVPAADYASGRAAKGYRCNTRQVGHFGQTGGFKVLRYVDPAGHVCAFYDSTLLFPKDLLTNAGTGAGVFVMDMSDPAHPKNTATLTTPAMLSPHESLLLNAKRGLLVADMGNPGTTAGMVDVYDVSKDCRHPVLDSSTPLGILGHESGFAPDGRTFYVSSTGGQTLTAIDLSNPRLPSIIAVKFGVVYHGMRVSDDGDRLYVADIGNAHQPGPGPTPGLTILDVSDIQHRRPDPQFRTVSHLTWPTVSIPQVPLPMTIRGHHYLFEIDEYTAHTVGSQALSYDPDDPVGAARIIDIDNERKPFVVSNLRLTVNQPASRAGSQRNDPGAGFAAQGYAGHYCSLPREVNPKIVACSFIVSGERIFDIRHPRHPREIAYFNRPATTPSVSAGAPSGPAGAFAMSAPAWDLHRHEVWYADGNSGLWVFRITNGRWPRGL